MYKTNLSAKAVAPAGPPKAAAAAPKGGATSTTKESVQAPADSPLEVKPEDVTPFPCALPDDIVVEILASRFVRQIIFIFLPIIFQSDFPFHFYMPNKHCRCQALKNLYVFLEFPLSCL